MAGAAICKFAAVITTGWNKHADRLRRKTLHPTDNPAVGDLVISPPPANPTGLTISVYDDYDPTDPTVGTLLDAADPLIDGTTYFIEVKDSNDCVASSRAETNSKETFDTE